MTFIFERDLGNVEVNQRVKGHAVQKLSDRHLNDRFVFPLKWSVHTNCWSYVVSFSMASREASSLESDNVTSE